MENKYINELKDYLKNMSKADIKKLIDKVTPEILNIPYDRILQKDLDYFHTNHCRLCGTQRCYRIYDEESAIHCQEFIRYLKEKRG